jgi:sec-independent protein translocase protein TatC
MTENKEILNEAPIEVHINELQNRIIRCVIVFIVLCCFSMFFANDVYDFLAAPLVQAITQHSTNKKLIFTGITEGFMTHMRLSLFLGLGLSFPYIIFQIYRFLSPGLYKKEKRVILPFVLGSICLFFIGISIAFFLVAPIACKFFISFEGLINYNHSEIPIVLEARISEYLSTITQLLISFGIVFQLPIILLMLSKLGVVSVEVLRKYRRHAIVLNFVVAAIITPPDVISQVSLAIPMVLLYELSIFFIKKFN